MKNHFRIFKVELSQEVDNLQRLDEELSQLLPLPSSQPGGMKVRAIGSILHDFYSGVEKAFQRIALEIDGDLPRGEEWHIDLLKRMTTAIPEIRPIVVSKELAMELEEYLRFRHLFRNIYGFGLNWERCKNLAEKLPSVFQKFKGELQIFFCFLDTLSQNTT